MTEKKKPQPDPRVQDTGKHVRPGSVKMMPTSRPPRHAKKGSR